MSEEREQFNDTIESLTPIIGFCISGAITLTVFFVDADESTRDAGLAFAGSLTTASAGMYQSNRGKHRN